MDFESLIARLKCPYEAFNCSMKINERDFCDCEQCRYDAVNEIADAIKVLSAERDAMLKVVYGECFACKHNDRSALDYPCWHCKNGNGMSDYWELRNSQSGEE